MTVLPKSGELFPCPFCEEPEFDLIGIKHHLKSGYCKVFEAIETPDEERERKRVERGE